MRLSEHCPGFADQLVAPSAGGRVLYQGATSRRPIELGVGPHPPGGHERSGFIASLSSRRACNARSGVYRPHLMLRPVVSHLQY